MGLTKGGSGTVSPPTFPKVTLGSSSPGSQLAKNAEGVMATAVVPKSAFLKNDLLFIVE